jgi:PAS domain S-box-containing protein
MMRIQEKIVGIGIGLVIALLVVIAILSFNQSSQTNKVAARIAHTRVVLIQLSDLYNTTIQHASAARDYALQAKEEDVTRMQTTASELVSRLNGLRTVTNEPSFPPVQLDSLTQYINRRIEFSNQIIDAGRKKGQAGASDLYQTGIGREYNNMVHSSIQKLQADELSRLQQDEQKTTYGVTRISHYLFGLLAVIFILILILLQKIQLDNAKRKEAEYNLTNFNRQLQEQVEEKTAELTGLFERITDGFISLDKNFCFTYVNKKAGEMTNRDPASFIGKSMWDEFGDSIPSTFRDAMVTAMEEQRYIHFEEYAPGYDRWFEDHLYPSPAGLSIFFRDISERKRADEAIRKSEERYRALIEQASDAIMITDHKGNLIDVNTSFCTKFGYTKEDVKGLSIAALIDADQLKNDPVRFDLLMAGENILRERKMVHKNGSIIQVEANVKMLPDGRMLAIARDITERKRISAEKEKMHYLLNERVKELTTLYRTGQILQAEDKEVKDILEEIVSILPGGWQYPAITAARITLGEIELATHGFTDTPYKQTASFKTFEDAAGTIEIVYLEERPSETEGPFLAEERHLLNMVAEMLRIYFIRKGATALILKEKNLSDTIINTLPGMFYLRSLVNGKCLRWNRNFEQVTGATAREIAESDLYDFIAEEDRPKAREAVDKAVKEGSSAVEAGLKTKNGNIPYYYITGIPIEYENQPCIMGTGIDISSLKKAEEELRLSEQKYKLLFENNPLPTVVFSKINYSILEVNAAAISHYGYTREEFLRMNAKDLRPAEDVSRFEEQVRETIRTYKNLGVWRHKKKDDSIINVEITGHEIVYRNTPARLVLCNDVTEKLKTEENLKRSYQEIRQLASNIEKIREEEKIKIAREIHDELGQQLTGLKMDVSWLSKKLDAKDTILLDKTREIMQLLDQAVKSVRRIASELRPGLLDDLGLVAAIEWQGEEFEKRSGIKVQFDHEIKNETIPPALATGLFRIYQESLTNVARHAHANKVMVSLHQTDHEVVLEITDDGKGFDSKDIKNKKTLGLLGMKERTMMMGGKYEVVSNPGKGTTVVVSVPLPDDKFEKIKPGEKSGV